MPITFTKFLPKKTMSSLSLMTLAIVCAPTQMVSAEDAPFSLSANVAVVSEYRFRGISMSDKDIAIQGGVDLATSSGFYAGTWGSSIETYGGSETELDVYAGYATELGDLSFDVGILAYTYPGSTDTTYWEAYSSVGGSLGDLGWTLGAAYAFDQSSIGSQDNIYVYLDGEYALGDSPISLTGHLAYEDGAFSFGQTKWDWAIGTSYAISDSVSVGVQYIDNNVKVDGVGKGGIVLTLGASF